MRLETFLASSRSLYTQATNQRRHAFKPCIALFYPLVVSPPLSQHRSGVFCRCVGRACPAKLLSHANYKHVAKREQEEMRAGERTTDGLRTTDYGLLCDIKPASRRGHGASRSAGCGGKALHIECNPSRNSPMGRAVGPPSSETPRSTPLALPYLSRVARGGCHRAFAVVESRP